MNVIERIINNIKPAEQETKISHYLITQNDLIELLRLAKLGQQIQRLYEYCPMDYGFKLDVCPSNRNCGECWINMFSSLPSSKEAE